MSDDKEMREAFEAGMGVKTDAARAEYDETRYATGFIQAAWIGWQACWTVRPAAQSNDAEDAAPAKVQWWLAKLDIYGTARPFDGPHDECSGADKAAYLMPALGLQKAGEKYAVVETRITEPKPSSKGVNHEAIALNRHAAGLEPKS